jgi:cytochrome c55X
MPDTAAAALAVLIGLQAAEAPPVGRQGELLHRLKHDCGSCHGMTLKGGLGPSLLPDALAGKDSESLAAIVLHGVPGTPMPPWQGEISAAEVVWLVARLKRGIAP